MTRVDSTGANTTVFRDTGLTASGLQGCERCCVAITRVFMPRFLSISSPGLERSR